MSVIGKAAPSWKGQAAKAGEIVTLSSDELRGKWVVLFFYPLDFTFVCPTEIVAYDAAYERFTAAGAEVIGVSIDSVHTHLAYMRTPRSEAGVGELKFALLSDMGRELTNGFDVADATGLKALRATFIIDPNGVVQSAMINNLSIGRNVDETFRLLRAAQYAFTNGDVCPANWEDGDEGMKATLTGVKGVINH